MEKTGKKSATHNIESLRTVEEWISDLLAGRELPVAALSSPIVKAFTDLIAERDVLKRICSSCNCEDDRDSAEGEKVGNYVQIC